MKHNWYTSRTNMFFFLGGSSSNFFFYNYYQLFYELNQQRSTFVSIDQQKNLSIARLLSDQSYQLSNEKIEK